MATWHRAGAQTSTVVAPPPACTVRRPGPAFVFAEMQHTDHTPADWMPKYADYLALAFWTATAFSPTDVSVIKRWAKLMMMTEATVSLIIGVLVVARAVNVMQ
jgi:uncharacterized membrane protein